MTPRAHTKCSFDSVDRFGGQFLTSIRLAQTGLTLDTVGELTTDPEWMCIELPVIMEAASLSLCESSGDGQKYTCRGGIGKT